MDTNAETPDAIKTDEAGSTHSLKYSWFVVGLLMMAYTLSFVDRQILSLLIGPLKADLNLSDTQVSLLQGFAFALFYTICGIPCGRLVDRFNRKWLIVTGITFWSIMTAGCGFAKTYLSLFLMRMGVGIGEATLNPSAFSLISDYFKKEHLARAIGVYSVGIYFGAGMAYIVGGSVIGIVESMFGSSVQLLESYTIRTWQLTFMIVGIPGVLVAAAIALLLKEPVRTGIKTRAGDAHKQEPFVDVLKFIWTQRRTFIPLFLGISMISSLGYAVLSWGPEFFIRTYGLSKSSTGLVFGLIVMIFGSLGITHSGFIADRMIARGRSDAYYRVTAMAGLGLVPPCLLMPLSPTPEMAFVFFAPLIYFSAFPYSLLPASVQAITPNQMRGQISAIYLFVSNIVGIGMGPLAVGLLTDHVFADESDLRYSLMILCLVTAPMTALFLSLGFAGLRDSIEQAKSWAGD